jgi:glycosyltransferase involved in cell wall biosynthesis
MTTAESVNILFNNNKCCVIVPTYNNEKTIGKVIEDILKFSNHVIIVNDGSTDGTQKILKKYDSLEIISYPENQGKGYALRKGFESAINLGYEFAVTIDSDGQHNPADISKFTECIKGNPNILVLGERNMDQRGIPLKSNFGRNFSNFWFKVETGIKRSDTQTGFRLYPLNMIQKTKFFTKKFEFEIEVLVRLAWKGCKIEGIPVSVYYPPKNERISHFRPFLDFMRISVLNTILVTITLLYILPKKFFRKLTITNIKKYFNDNIIHSKDSNLKISLSIALGVFTGILPIWGYQIITVLILAYLFRLNKIIAFTASNISIPPMIPLILYGSICLGRFILGNRYETTPYYPSLDFSNIKYFLYQYIIGSILLAMISSVISGLFSFITLAAFRKKE